MTNRYLVIYAKSASETGFTGYAPDVAGCYSEGATLEEMRAMLTEALTFHLEGTAEDGLAIPIPTTPQLAFDEDRFEGVSYFIVEHLDIPVPQTVNEVRRIAHHEAAAA